MRTDRSFEIRSGSASQRQTSLLTFLALALAFSVSDRLAVGLLMQDIKSDLALSDGQLGLLTGFAFALFYSIAGIPIARTADRGNRVLVIAASTMIWSVAVAACALTANFIQLLAARVVAAVGEAGVVPPSNSLLADAFAREDRPRAMAIYMLGGSVSAVIGYFGAGWLNQLIGWRLTLASLAIPGLLLSVSIALFVRDPRSGGKRGMRSDLASGQQAPSKPFGGDIGVLVRNRTFRNLLLAFSISSFFAFGIAQWQPTFFIRSHHMDTATLGSWLALIYGTAGCVGTYAGGELASKWAAGNEALQLRIGALVYTLFGLVSAAIYLAPSRGIALSLTWFSILGGALVSAPLFAALQAVVPSRMRAVSVALIYLCANLLGMGLGPVATGLISDVLRNVAGQDSLRLSLLILCPGYAWGGWHLWRASRTIADDARTAAAGDAEELGRVTSEPAVTAVRA